MVLPSRSNLTLTSTRVVKSPRTRIGAEMTLPPGVPSAEPAKTRTSTVADTTVATRRTGMPRMDPLLSPANLTRCRSLLATHVGGADGTKVQSLPEDEIRNLGQERERALWRN